MKEMSWSIFYKTCLMCFVVAWGGAVCHAKTDQEISFKYKIIDTNGPNASWGKTVGDINGDGLVDLIVSGHERSQPDVAHRILRRLGLWSDEDHLGEIVWYENPKWTRHLVSTDYANRTDIEVVDIDRDGKNDIVTLTDVGIVWLKNPQWTPTIVHSKKFHDIEIHDFDKDGDMDIVARNQSLFNYNDGDEIHFFRQDASNKWVHFSISSPHGEGLSVADMDNDQYLDIVVNQVWFKNPGNLEIHSVWSMNTYSTSWKWLDVFVATGDVNNDGRRDIVLTPSEEAGQRYRISWFEAPGEKEGDWVEHIVDAEVEAVYHFVAAEDMDNDGDRDIVVAQMNQGQDPDEVSVYLNQADGLKWSKQVIDSGGSHNMRAIDIDNDKDIDLFGAHWKVLDYYGGYPIRLWENQTNP